MKTCPDCAELVRDDARVCRHCSYRFDRSLLDLGQHAGRNVGCGLAVLVFAGLLLIAYRTGF